jgi:hypothetical protein
MNVALEEEFNRQDPDLTAQVLKAKESPADAMIIWSALQALWSSCRRPRQSTTASRSSPDTGRGHE